MKKHLQPIADYIKVIGHFINIRHAFRKSVGIRFCINIRPEKFGIIFKVGFNIYLFNTSNSFDIDKYEYVA